MASSLTESRRIDKLKTPMKFVKSVLKYLGFFLLGVFVCAVVGLTGVSYYAIDQLVKATAPEGKSTKKMPVAKASVMPSLEDSVKDPEAPNPNLKELTRIGYNYDAEFAIFDKLAEDVSKRSLPEICTTLCNPSYLDRERLSTERSAYLASYYKQEGTRALQDPVFRMKLEEIGFLSRLFPPSLRFVLKQIDLANRQNKEVDKFGLAVHLEFAVLKEISSITARMDSMKQDTEKLKLLREFMRSCEQGTPRKKVISECHSQIAN
ncbi:hypothetical protein [Bdellovibrio bacteriovorus]|uniref:hypothetical protein n=1 Tax=Bdellovibrio TaxID=958 RepID=UPI0035A9943F